MNNFFFTQPLWQNYGLAVIRIITGLLMAYHGLEVFDTVKMNDYRSWDSIKALPAASFLVTLGKGLEFVTGILFVLGLFTRLAALTMAVIMLFICFVIGTGKFYYEDQHPFILALLALVFFFTGPTKWSIDQYVFGTKNANQSY